MSVAQDEASVTEDPQPAVIAPTASPRGPADYAIVRYVKEYFSTGNLLVKVGVIILFFGVAFLLKYAAEHSNVPIEFRLVAVAIGAIALLAVGWRLRLKRPAYASVLQGGAIGVLYLLVFAALRLYQLLPPGLHSRCCSLSWYFPPSLRSGRTHYRLWQWALRAVSSLLF